MVRLLTGTAFCLVFAIAFFHFGEVRSENQDFLEITLLTTAAWGVLLVFFREGPIVGVPLGLFGCVAAMVTPQPDASPAFVAVSTILLLIAGCLLFISSMIHPAEQALPRKIQKTVSGLFPQLLVVSMAAILMFSTANLGKELVQELNISFSLPTDTGGEICTLVKQAPRFKNEEIGRVQATAGPLPEYLAQAVYNEYYSGTWRDKTSFIETPEAYGERLADTDSPVKSSNGKHGRTNINMWKEGIDFPVPFGADRVSMENIKHKKTTGENVRTRTHSFNWKDTPLTKTVAEGVSAAESPQSELSRLQLLAQRLDKKEYNDKERINRVVHHLQRNLNYDAVSDFQAPVEGRQDPVEYFLFDRKRGWCIHFAAASTLLLKAMEVPARFVTGYRLSETGTNSAIIKDKYSHAWCEALIEVEEGSGVYQWTIVDPAPARYIEQSRNNTKGIVVSVIVLVGILLLFGFINFKRIRLKDLRDEARHRDPESSHRERIRATYRRVLRYLHRLGIEKPASSTPRAFAENKAPAHLSDDLNIIITAYEKVTYMGYINLEGEVEKVEEAENRILGLTK